MKNYRIKNYKGNLVESLTKFVKSHKGMRIVEAVEEKDELKVKTEAESGYGKKKIDEASGKKVWVVMLVDDSEPNNETIVGICSSNKEANDLQDQLMYSVDDPNFLAVKKVNMDEVLDPYIGGDAFKEDDDI